MAVLLPRRLLRWRRAGGIRRGGDRECDRGAHLRTRRAFEHRPGLGTALRQAVAAGAGDGRRRRPHRAGRAAAAAPGVLRAGSGSAVPLGFAAAGDDRAAVRRDRRGNALPRLRFPGAPATLRGVPDHPALRRAVRRNAPRQPERKPPGNRQYGPVGAAFRRGVPAQRRALAADRPALRLERGAAPVRREPQRVYNDGDGLQTGLEWRFAVERRGLRSRRQPAHHRGGDRGAGAALPAAGPGRYR